MAVFFNEKLMIIIKASEIAISSTLQIFRAFEIYSKIFPFLKWPCINVIIIINYSLINIMNFIKKKRFWETLVANL